MGTINSAKFWGYVDKRGPDDCWNWTSHTHSSGPGKASYGKYSGRIATHISLELDGRPRPDSTHVAAHSCDNPLCVNPAHLAWKTSWQNHSEAHVRGRGSVRLLTDEQAEAVRSDPRSAPEIADALGVDSSTIYRIRKGQIYKRPLEIV